MEYTVFVSYSFKDRALVTTLQSFDLNGIDLYFAEADPQYGDQLPEKIEQKIESSDAMAVYLTKMGGESPSVNQEVGYAKRAHKRIIALVEEGVAVGVLLQGIERINFTVDKIGDALGRLTRYVKSKADDKRRSQLLWLGVLVGLFGLAVVAIIGMVVFGFFRSKRPS